MIEFNPTIALLLLAHMGNAAVLPPEQDNEANAAPLLGLPPIIPLLGFRTEQSSIYGNWGSHLAIDGNVDTWAHTGVGQSNQPWWTVDMGDNFTVTGVEIVNRKDLWARLGNIHVTVDGKPCGPDVQNGDFLYVPIECPLEPYGRHLKIQLIDAPDSGILTLAEVTVFGSLRSYYAVRGDRTIQSSTYTDWGSHLAVDGNPETWAHTEPWMSSQPWWAIDLGRNVTVTYVKILNRPGWYFRLGNVQVTVDDEPCGPKVANGNMKDLWIACPQKPTGRYMKIQLLDAPDNGILTLAEVTVFGIDHQDSETCEPLEPESKPNVRGLTCNDNQEKPNCTTKETNALYEALIANVGDFHIPAGLGRSTPVSVHPNALNFFPNDQHVTFGCLAPVGKGWIYFIGHEGEIMSTDPRFYKNLIEYLARGQRVDASSDFYLDYVKTKLGYSKGQSLGNNQLHNTDVYVCATYGIDNNVGEFVRQGGLLITGGHNWGDSILDSAFNRVFWKDGVALKDSYNADPYTVHPNEKPPMTLQAALDLIEIKETGMTAVFQRIDKETAKALRVLANGLTLMSGFPNPLENVPLAGYLYNTVLRVLPENTPLWSMNLPIRKSDIVPFELLSFQSLLNSIIPKHISFPIPTMRHWPGPVDLSIPRVTKDVMIDFSYNFIDGRFGFSNPWSWGIKHTGLYAAPDEKIVITIPGDAVDSFKVRIGVFSDSIWDHDEYHRFPDPLTTDLRLSNVETVIYSPHGGQIVFMVPPNRWGKMLITIAGGVEMMSYTYGETDQTKFKASLQGKKFPPFAEYHFDSGVFNLPTTGFNTDVDLEVVGNYWSKVIASYKNFVNLTVPRVRPIEFVCDIQITDGAGHSGYPAMGTLDWAGSIFDIAAHPTEGWGFRHEFGHDYQWRPWVLPPWTETSNNFMSLHFEQSVLNYTRWDHENVSQLSKSFRRHMRRDWCSKPRTAQPKDIYVNLELLVELVDGFTFAPMIIHSGEFTRLPKGTPLLDTDQKRYDQWFSRLCDIVKRDLTPQLVGIWKWTITEETLARVHAKGYEPWVHPDMRDCKFGA